MRILLGMGVILLATAGGASGQGFGKVGRPNYGPGYRGNISPYLNLARTGNFGLGNAGINYFLGTRSEQQRRLDARDFRSEIGNLTQETQNIITSGTTPQQNSLQKSFNNTGGYFPPAGPTIRRQ